MSSPQRHIPGYTMKKNPLVSLHHCPLFISLHNPSCTHVFLCWPEYYRQIMFILLCFTCFKKKNKLKVCANFLLSKSISTIFFNSICSLHISGSYTGNSPSISNLFIFLSVLCCHWSLMLLLQKDCNWLKAQMMVRIFSNKIFLN